MTLIFAYIAGLLTLLNPCVLPVLPLVIASTGARTGPYWLAAGMSSAFVLVGVGLTVFGQSLGISPQMMTHIGAVLMIAFGTILLIPQFNAVFERAVSGQAQKADSLVTRIGMTGPGGWFASGALLGAVWSPCIGPTLGGAIALAATGNSIGFATLTMVFFALGVSTLIILGGKGLGRTQWARRLSSVNKTLMGGALVLIGLILYLEIDKMVERWAIQWLPYWFQDLSITF